MHIQGTGIHKVPSSSPHTSSPRFCPGKFGLFAPGRVELGPSTNTLLPCTRPRSCPCRLKTFDAALGYGQRSAPSRIARTIPGPRCQQEARLGGLEMMKKIILVNAKTYKIHGKLRGPWPIPFGIEELPKSTSQRAAPAAIAGPGMRLPK